jgi:long-subunit acyl-CoA synthetase (AMP-forming)
LIYSFLKVIYGLTETSPVITASTIEDSLENRTQTCGRILKHLEAKIVDKNDKITKINEPGELYIRGYNVMIGYWDEKEKNDQVFTHDRFFKTG